MEGAVTRCQLLKWQEPAPLGGDMISTARRRQVGLQRGSAFCVTSARRLCRCVGFPWSSYSHFYLLEAKCQSVSVLPGTCRTEEFMVPNAKIPQAAESLLQPPLSAKKSLLLPAAPLSRGRFVPAIHILSSACRAPARVVRNALKIRNISWKY